MKERIEAMRIKFEQRFLKSTIEVFLVLLQLVSSQSTVPYYAVGSCYAGDCSANKIVNVENALQQTVYRLEMVVQQLQQTVSGQEIVVQQQQKTLNQQSQTITALQESVSACCGKPSTTLPLSVITPSTSAPCSSSAAGT